jgi:hypothetical protein
MALSGKYGKLGIPHRGIVDPVFILRAQDRLATATLESYRTFPLSVPAGPGWEK